MKSILFSLLLSVSSAVVFAQKPVIDSAAPGLRTQENSMPSRLSMTPTTTRQTQGEKGINEAGVKRTEAQPEQTQGKTFGEKVATGMQSGAGAVSSSYAAGRVAGTPIGGIVVKGGKNPAGKGIQENGIKRTESTTAEEKRVYTAGR